MFPDELIYPFFSVSELSKQLSTVSTCPIIPPTVKILTYPGGNYLNDLYSN